MPMSRSRRWVAPMAAGAVAWALAAGCRPLEDAAPPDPAPAGGAEGVPDVDGSAAGPVELTDGQVAMIRQLPEEEQGLALEQKACPVTGVALGDHGVPYRVEALGQPVFLCCAGCEGDVEADPEAILAKLNRPAPPAGAEGP